MEQETNNQNNVQTDARAIMKGTFSSNIYDTFRASSKGAIAGLFGGLVYGVFKGRDKFTSSVVGCFIGMGVGYAYSELFKKGL
jgi:hypothetical protein